MGDNITENLKGTAKEIAGRFSDDEDLEEEGRAQQEKARKREDAEAKEAEAVADRKEAAGREAEQRRNQD